MNDRAQELIAAASEIDPQTLQTAIAAIDVNCWEYLRWAELFSCRLESVAPGELHKFARALSLTLLGHLPTRPGTCPFCIQYDRDRACAGCGYAATHGRCDEDDSAFSRFIESFQELGRVIYQDTEGRSIDPGHAREFLRQSLMISKNTAQKMQANLSCVSALQLMELKANYLSDMIGILSVRFFSYEVENKYNLVIENLKNYW
ncbi:MAG: hypothetical protein WCG94_01020 [Methanothrix sp.]